MIIITGAAGFIGSALAWRLNTQARSDLILVDELGTDEKWKNLVSLKYANYIEKDEFFEEIRSPGISLEKAEAVIHMGACSSTTEKDASYLVRNNFNTSKQLAKWCRKNDIRFIYASSAATYGDGSKGYQDDELKISSLRPLNMYGYSKQMFDQWALQHGFLKSAVGLKFFNVYGPNEYHKGDMRSMVVKAWQQIGASGKVRLFKSYHPDYKDGKQMRDFIYIKDAVDMTLHFLDRNAPGGLYNIGTGTARTWLDMMNAIFNAMGIDPEIEYVDMPETLRGKYQYFTQAEMTRLQSAGCAHRAMSLEKGVADYVNYLKQGPAYLSP